MNKTNLDPSKVPGYPKPRPEKPRHDARQQPVPPVAPVRTRLGWSRSIIDKAWEPAAQADGLAYVPPVRSMAALRARAGESYRPATPPATPQPAPVVVVQPAVVAPVVPAPEPEWERPIQHHRPSLFRSLWETVQQYLPRAPQISE